MHRRFFLGGLIILLLCTSALLKAQTPGWAWTQQLQTAEQYGYPADSAVDGQGNIVTALMLNGPVFMGGQVINTFPSLSTIPYLWKQDSAGNTVWVKQLECQPYFPLDCVAADGLGNIYLSGEFYGSLTLNGITLTTSTFGRALVKLDAQGNYLWVHDISGCGSVRDMAADPGGYVYFTGWFTNTAVYDTLTLNTGTTETMFLARMDPSGSWLWARQAPGNREVEGLFLAPCGNGECFVSGVADGSVNFGEVSLGEQYVVNQYFVAKYAANGVCQWAGSIYPSNWYDYAIYPCDIAQDGLGNAFLLYEYYDDPLDYTALRVCKFTYGGSSYNVFMTGTQGNNRGTSLAIDSGRNLYILGLHYGPCSFLDHNFPAENGALLIKLNANNSIVWAVDPSPGQYSRYWQLCVTSAGLPYLVLSTFDTYPVGPLQTYPGMRATYVAGLTAGGTVSWLRSTWLNHFNSEGTDICQDSGGNNFVCGNYRGAFFREDSLYAAFDNDIGDIYAARLTNGGTWLWTACAGGDGLDQFNAITTDGAQNSYLTGSFSGTIHFGGISLAANGDKDIFVAKADESGNWLWAAGFGGTGPDSGSDIALDFAGNIYIAGYFSSLINFGGTDFASSGNKDFFVLKLDSNGLPLQATTGGGSLDDDAAAIIPVGNGNAMVCGNFRQSASFGNYQLQAWGGSDIFLGCLNSSFNWIYAVAAGSATNDSVAAMAADINGNVYLTGHFQGLAIFGDYSLQSDGDKDVFVAKNSFSNWVWAVRGGGPGTDVANAIAVNSDGTACLTGFARGTITYGAHTVQNYGVQDILAASADTNGNWLWAKLTGPWDAYNDNGNFQGNGIAVNQSGNWIVTGRYSDYTHFGQAYCDPFGEYETFVSLLQDNVSSQDVTAPQVGYVVLSAYPNPFSEKAQLKVNLKEAQPARLQVFNIRGERVRTLYEGDLPKGESTLTWDGRDNSNRPCARGIYLLKASTGGKSVALKLVRL